MGISKFDQIYRRFIITKFFSQGWGKPEDLKEFIRLQKLLKDRSVAQTLVSPNHPVDIQTKIKTDHYAIYEGSFRTPLVEVSQLEVPRILHKVRFEMIVPSKVNLSTNEQYSDFFTARNMKPACIHLAGTGDHGFNRRREFMAKPLLKHGITSIILENPFYGSRKPKLQTFSGLLHVNDLFVMGLCLVLESSVLLHWLKKNGYGPLGLTGISMGGHMASLAATAWPEKLALVPCMSWTSASVVWTEGCLSEAIPWKTLGDHYSKDHRYSDVHNMLNGVDMYGMTRMLHKDVPQPFNPLWIFQDNQEKNLNCGYWLQKKKLERDTLLFMKSLMDHMTHLGNYPEPVDTSLCTFVVAKKDGYYPQHSITPITQIWKECEVREIDTGHVAGFLVCQPSFTAAIIDTFHRLVQKEEQKNTSSLAHNTFTHTQHNFRKALTRLGRFLVSPLYYRLRR